MFVTFKGKKVDLYTDYKSLIRRFNVKADVVNAQVQAAGDKTYVAIVMSNGKSVVYDSDGRLIR
jgi:hypothetical protein